MNTCENCQRSFSFDDEGGFIDPIGQVFCEDCDPDECLEEDCSQHPKEDE